MTNGPPSCARVSRTPLCGSASFDVICVNVRVQRGSRGRRSTEETRRDDLARGACGACGDERPGLVDDDRRWTEAVLVLVAKEEREISKNSKFHYENKKRKRTDKNRKMDENQQQGPIFRSLNSQHESFVKFINTTPHTITLYWMDYQGQAISYGDLSPGDYREINTFHTHPWIFVNKETGVRYLVNQRDVFFPAPWFLEYRGVRWDELPQRIERTNVYIVLPMFTLQQLSLRVIKTCLTYDSQAFLLDIPRSLQLELFTMLPRKTCHRD